MRLMGLLVKMFVEGLQSILTRSVAARLDQALQRAAQAITDNSLLLLDGLDGFRLVFVASQKLIDGYNSPYKHTQRPYQRRCLNNCVCGDIHFDLLTPFFAT